MSTEKKETVYTVAEYKAESERFDLDQRKAKAYGSSMMLPAHLRDVGSMMVINQMSRDLKIPMLLLAQNIFMVKGKIGMSAQLVISLINSSGIYDHGIKFEERAEPFGVRAYAEIDGERVDGIWIDEEMIVANGWYSNVNWKSLKPLMARYRSATYFARLNCPMVLMGFQTDEEIIDVSIAEPQTDTGGSTLNDAVSHPNGGETVSEIILDVETEDLGTDDRSDQEIAFDHLKSEAHNHGVTFRKDITYPSLFKKVEDHKMSLNRDDGLERIVTCDGDVTYPEDAEIPHDEETGEILEPNLPL